MMLPSGEETSENLTASPGVESWILSLHHFLANHSQMLENGRENSILKGVISGPIHSESLGKWDPDSLSWRTSQASLWEVMDGHHMGAPWSESWPKQGMTRSGELFPLRTQERLTSETGGGSWPVRWNTPNTMDSLSAKSQQALDHEHETARPGRSNPNNLRDQVAVSEGHTKWHIPTPTSSDVYTANMESSQQSDDSMHSVSLPDFVGRFPTPSTMDHIDRKQMRPSRAATNRKTGYLSEMIGNWPMPNASSGGTHSGISAETAWSELAKGHQIGLGAAAAMWPTPTSTERSGTNPNTGKGEGLSKTAKMWPTPDAYNDPKSGGSSPHQPSWQGSKQQLHLHHAAKMFPTPRAAEGYQGDGAAEAYAEAGFKQPKIRNGMVRASSTFDTTLTTAVQAQQMFPTPRAGKTTDEDEESWLARHAEGKVATPPLALAARMLPTPSSGGDSGRPHGIRGGSWPTPKSTNSGPDHARQFREGSGGDDLVTAVDGSLSPDWVSWLMGLPVGWTSLEPLPRQEYLDWFHAQIDGSWWQEERGLPRVATGIKDRVNRLKCLGNGIVPASLALFLRGTR